jgi:DNA-binding ferritin-like protein
MEEELKEIQEVVRQVAERLNRCRGTSVVLAQAYDSLRQAAGRVNMERAAG